MLCSGWNANSVECSSNVNSSTNYMSQCSSGPLRSKMMESWLALAHGVFAVVAAPGLAHGARIVDLVAVPAAGALALQTC